MSWAFDAASGATATGTDTVSWAHTIGGGSNRLLCLASCNEQVSPGQTTISVKYNAVAAMDIRSDDADSGSHSNNVNIRYMLETDLPSAGTYTCVATLSSAADCIAGEAVSYSGIAQQGPEANNGNNTTFDDTINATLTTITDNALLFAAGTSNYDQDHVASDGLTERREDQTGGYEATLSSNDKNVVTAGPTSGRFNTGSGRLAISMAAFKEASGIIVTRDVLMPVSWSIPLQIDQGFPLSFVGFSQKDSVILTEWIVGIVRENPAAAEWLAGAISDNMAPFNFVAPVGIGYLTVSDWLVNVSIDKSCLSEWAVSLAMDGQTFVDFLNSVSASDNAAALDFVVLVGIAYPTVLDWLINVGIDKSYLSEWAAALAMDGQTDLDFLNSVSASGEAPLSFITAIQKDATIQLEWGGVLVITRDAVIPVDVRGVMMQDAPFDCDFISPLASNKASSVEWLVSTVANMGVAVEVLAGLYGEVLAVTEYLGTVTNDGVMPIDAVGLTRADTSVASDWLAAAKRDDLIFTDWTSPALSDTGIPVEILAALQAEIETIVDYLQVFSADRAIPFSYLTLTQRSQTCWLEWIIPADVASFTSTISWLGELFKGMPIEVEYSGAEIKIILAAFEMKQPSAAFELRQPSVVFEIKQPSTSFEMIGY